MEFQELSMKGLMLLTPQVFEDERGFFLERFSKRLFEANGICTESVQDGHSYSICPEFVQDSHSYSVRNVLRGLHFQRPPFAQDKLVWVTRGEVFDVAVDLRKDSPSFGKWEAVILSETNKRTFWIPKGFAHGFVTLSDEADLFYKMSAYYSKEHEAGVIWNDPDLDIEWPIYHPILSSKDKQLVGLRGLGQIF